MKRKMYILRTWMYDNKESSETSIEFNKYEKHPTKLSVYIIDRMGEKYPKGSPYITTSRLSAKKFYTKKDAIKYGKDFGGCYVDCVWHIKKECPNGEVLNLWE